METRIKKHFADSAQLKIAAAETLAPAIAHAASVLIKAFDQGQRVLTCGNGGSACDAQHLASELVNRFETNRRALPAMALTCDSAVVTSIANDVDYAEIFARQIQAWGQAGDVLVAISTSGRSANILQAIRTAQQKHMLVVNLGGRDGGAASKQLNPTDVDIRVPAQSTARIQEVHLLVIHCLCDLIDAHYTS